MVCRGFKLVSKFQLSVLSAKWYNRALIIATDKDIRICTPLTSISSTF